MTFEVVITRDCLDTNGEVAFDLGLGLLDAQPHMRYRFMDTFLGEATPAQIGDADGALWMLPKITAASLAGAERLVGVARLGVGYDMVDLDACTAADVAVFITAGAVNRPVAESIVTFMLMLGHKVMLKDRLVRAGRWNEKVRHNGTELGGRVIGSVGFGGIGGELYRLLQGFGIGRFLVYDPYLSRERAAAMGVEVVDLATLLSEADYVTINCPLTPETRGLIGARELALMRPSAYLINTARGGIVDEAALYDVLQNERIAGAAVDVFAVEPPPPDHPFFGLPNIIVTPHAIAWTEELFVTMGRMACGGLIKLSHGEVPPHIVNRAVVERPGFQAKLARLREQHAR